MRTLQLSAINGARGAKGVATSVKNLVLSAGWPMLTGGTLAVMAGVIADSDPALFFGAIVAGAGSLFIHGKKGGEI
ncbi:MAG: hypothetical protein HDR95_04590 [Bacteroides sp.]|nr:hypothetical protein [Bacteroides sp.]